MLSNSMCDILWASCASILYISVTPGSKTPISAPSRTKTPAVAGNGVPAHRTSAGGTQGTRVSAADQLASSKALVADRGRVIQPKSESCPMDGDMEKERPTPWHRTLHGPRTTADGIWPSPGMLPTTPTSIADPCRPLSSSGLCMQSLS